MVVTGPEVVVVVMGGEVVMVEDVRVEVVRVVPGLPVAAAASTEDTEDHAGFLLRLLS